MHPRENSLVWSEICEKAYGTLNRNKNIRKLALSGKSLAEIGRQFGISRQAVHQIIKRRDKNDH